MKKPAQPDATALSLGLIVAHHGRHFLLETNQGARLLAYARGKKSPGLVGDQVWWQASGDGAAIAQMAPRRNVFYRQDALRTKSFAANLDQILILLAAKPEFSSHQLARALIAAEAMHITPLIVLNKRDLAEPFAKAWAWLQPYRDMAYTVLPLSLKTVSSDQAPLWALLQGKTTLVLGPSGVGKSTLINLLVPDAAAQTGTLSHALNSGKHTTTCTTWYWVDRRQKTALIDSPGFQEFGLHHIEPAALAHHMPDLRQHAAACKFYNCSHRHEPGCAVLAAVCPPGADQTLAHSVSQTISANRYKIYGDLYAELSAAQKY